METVRDFIFLGSKITLDGDCSHEIKRCLLFRRKAMTNLISVQSLSRIQLFEPYGLHHARLPCPSPTPRACSDSCPLSQWCHPAISSSVIPFSCLQSFPASGSFLISRLFISGDQSTGASVSSSVLPKDIKHWFPSGLTGLISLPSNGFSSLLQHHSLSSLFSANTLVRGSGF